MAAGRARRNKGEREGVGEDYGVGGCGMVGRREVRRHMSGGDTMGIRLQREEEEKRKKGQERIIGR